MPRFLTSKTTGRAVSVRPGQILGVSGRGRASYLIMLRTRSLTSHIAVVYDDQHIVESTSLNGFVGVSIRTWDDFLANQKGVVKLYDVADDIRAVSSAKALQEFLAAQVGKKYDYLGAARSGMDLLDGIPGLGWLTRAKEDEAEEKWFCSELAYRALEHFNPDFFPDRNESEMTPKDVIRLPQWRAVDRIL